MTTQKCNFFKYTFLSLGILLSFSSALVSAGSIVPGRIEVASTFNPVGSGARSLGMGGAFISIADDATAASWNPGALIQLRSPEVSITAGGFKRSENNSFNTNPEANGNEQVTNSNLNYLSASYPCGSDKCGKNMIFSINYQNLYNFDKHWNFPIDENVVDASSTLIRHADYDYQQSGDLYALGLAFAIQATETLSLGFTLNYWGDSLKDSEWQQNYKIQDHSSFSVGTANLTKYINRNTIEKYQFDGVNANLGLFWNFYQHEEKKLTLGLVLKTPFTADVKHTTIINESTSTNGGANTTENQAYSVDEKIDMPMSFGVGLAYQVADELTIAGDIYRTSWDKFIRTDSNGNKLSVISDVPEADSKVDATYQVRLGVEYRIISQEFGNNYIIPIRGGIFYDPAPAEDTTDKYYGFSLGTGIAYKKYVFDIAYQYRFANDVTKYVFPKQGFSQDVKEHTLYSSMAIRF